MILVIDNYDSFTFNLVQLLGELGAEVAVHRNDQIGLDQIRGMQPDGILISPGPSRPEQAGISLDVIQELGPTIPILGVCLGHQAIGQAYGGRVVRAPELVHGKVRPIRHRSQGLFAGLPDPFLATRYHSLVVDCEGLPDCLMVTAQSDDGLIMGLQHREYPVHGVQFHPESILTQGGRQLLQNFLAVTQPALVNA